MAHVMKLYPWDVVVAAVAEKRKDKNVNVHQQWNCEHCGVKQTMETPNVLYEQGQCEKCQCITDIKKNGMNFMLHIRTRRPRDARH